MTALARSIDSNNPFPIFYWKMDKITGIGKRIGVPSCILISDSVFPIGWPILPIGWPTLHMVIKRPTRPVDFNRLSHSSSCWFQRVAGRWFQRVEAEHANFIDHTGAAAERPPLFCPIHWHVQPQLVELNDLQLVEFNELPNVPICWNKMVV